MKIPFWQWGVSVKTTMLTALLLSSHTFLKFIPPKSGPPKLIADNCPFFPLQQVEQLTVVVIFLYAAAY